MRGRPSLGWRRLAPLVVLLSLPLTTSTVLAIEQTTYELVSHSGDLELRRYPTYYIASTPAGTEFEETGSNGFRTLFRYISGANESGEEIAMTAPVIQARSEDQWALAFVVPASYSPDVIPAPQAPGVTIERVPGGLYAVTRFSGNWSEERFMEKESALLRLIETEGFEVCGPTRFARYDPPFKPPFLRRNEVLIPVDCAAADRLPDPAGSTVRSPAAGVRSPGQ